MALGILIPPGTRTLVILRPRALTFDLLAARWNGVADHAPEFCAFSRDDAAQVARRLIEELKAATNPIQTFGVQGSFQVWLRLREFVWIVCRRSPGEAYQPVLFGTQEQAVIGAERLAPFVQPPAGAVQQYYFNTQNFS
jgi:hypothetical protein